MLRNRKGMTGTCLDIKMRRCIGQHGKPNAKSAEDSSSAPANQALQASSPVGRPPAVHRVCAAIIVSAERMITLADFRKILPRFRAVDSASILLTRGRNDQWQIQ